MRTTDANQLNMALAVQKVILRYQGVWNNYQGFGTEVDAMNEQLLLIKKYQQRAEVKTKGVTEGKAHAAERAVKMAMDLGGNAYVYAKKMGNEIWKAQFKLSKRSLNNVEGVVSVSRLKELHDNMEVIIEALSSYVTMDELNVFKEAITDYESRLAEPRDVMVGRGKSNDILMDGVKGLKSIFENMDNLMSKFENSEFEKEYKRARIVIDLGSRKGKKDDADETTDSEATGTAA